MRAVQLFAFAGLAPMLLGCSAVPIQDDVTRKDTFRIVQQIRCEAKKAVEQYGRNLPNAAVAYEFTFDVTEGNTAMANATGFVPFLNGGTFSLAGNAGINGTRETNRNFKTVDTFADLMNARCREGDLAKDFLYPVSGDVGMEEVVKTFIMLSRIDDASVPAPEPGTTAPAGTTAGTDVFTFADTLTFTTTLTAGITPTLHLSPIPQQFRIMDASANFMAGRHDVHTVVVALAVVPQPKTTPPGHPAATAKLARPALGSTIHFSAVGSTSPSSVLTTTAVQSTANARDRALIELDRQRILALQARTPNLIVGP
jgi:hypothetical protein